MKMPDGGIAPLMFASCGMNCMVCYKHCCHKRPCAGCLAGGEGKPEHCRKCRIRDCAAGRGLTYCHACPDFPCRQVKALDRSYRTRYGASLIENSLCVRQDGLEAFMERQKKRYTCPACGGIVSLHDSECSECRLGAEPAQEE